MKQVDAERLPPVLLSLVQKTLPVDCWKCLSCVLALSVFLGELFLAFGSLLVDLFPAQDLVDLFIEAGSADLSGGGSSQVFEVILHLADILVDHGKTVGLEGLVNQGVRVGRNQGRNFIKQIN
jgi:hypothetical protein